VALRELWGFTYVGALVDIPPHRDEFYIDSFGKSKCVHDLVRCFEELL
jgi:hypothetical protein